jgi:acetyl-CoA acyltransferase 2
MSVAAKNIFITGAKRTPFGNFGGSLKKMSATELAAHASKGALLQAGIDGEKIDETFFGNVIQSSLDACYLARHAGLKAGAPMHSPAMTINRLCGSGFETVMLGAEAIIDGRANITLSGGSENMSAAPMVIDGVTARFDGAALGKGMKMEDSLWAGLTDSLYKTPMGITAEKLGAKYGITREECDEFAVRSQNLTQAAIEAGIFASEIHPIELKGKKGKVINMTQDEAPRFNCTLPDLSKLKSVFQEDGLVTAASASGITDGAAALILSSEEAMKSNNMTPLTRVVAWARVGCDPSIMGIGPVPAIRKVLDATGLSLDQIDLVEINEAFAAQYLSCEKELGLDRSKANLNGGAISIGHPLGASGARILTHLSHELGRTNKKYGMGAACIGGGQGIAVLLENMQ